jgi:hypothetical protein
MKRHSAKRSSGGMRFFTSELYLRFNSSDDQTADEANDQWEAAIAGYQKHLKGIRAKLPPAVQQLARLSLHDAEVLKIDQNKPTGNGSSRPNHGTGMAIISVRQGDEILSLIYTLSGRLHELPASRDWKFSSAALCWLYDELDLDPRHPGACEHRILLSDGRTLEVPFHDLAIHRYSLNGKRALREYTLGKAKEGQAG